MGKGGGGGWPSTTGNPSGGGRSNNSSSSEDDDDEDEEWLRYHAELTWKRFKAPSQGADYKSMPLDEVLPLGPSGEIKIMSLSRRDFFLLISEKSHMWDLAKRIRASGVTPEEFESKHGIKFTNEGKQVVDFMCAILRAHGDKATALSELELDLYRDRYRLWKM